MTRPQRRYRGSRVLLALAVVSVLAHLYGLYRPAGPPSVAWFPGWDKVAHLAGFALPVCLVLLLGGVSRRFVLTVVGVFALHALVSELAQHVLYSGRTGDPVDVLADLVGVALGWGVATLLRTSSGRSILGNPRSDRSNSGSAPPSRARTP